MVFDLDGTLVAGDSFGAFLRHLIMRRRLALHRRCSDHTRLDALPAFEDVLSLGRSPRIINSHG